MDALKAQVAKGPVRCVLRDVDQYGRSIATCQLPGGDDAGDFMVKNGLAVAYRSVQVVVHSHTWPQSVRPRQYSSQYVAAEEAARAARRGIWQGAFEVPSEWRKRTKAQEALTGVQEMMCPRLVHPLATGPAIASVAQPVKVQQQVPAKGCDIKGNISAKGERIYHVPGGQYYESVKIDTEKGERWFCNEAEAEQAGWRRSSQ